MDLKEFVQSTLSQLIDGICASQEEKKGIGALVVPTQIWTPDAKSQPMVFTSPRNENNVGRYVSLIEFDVTLVLERKAKGGGELKLVVFHGGGTGSVSSTNTHRVKFTVPVALPVDKGEQIGDG